MSARMTIRLMAVLLMLLSGTAIACEGLAASGAWVREPPPVAKVAAAYVLLTNTGDEPFTIEHLASDCCGSVMMHDTIRDGDRVRMSHLDSLRLEAGGTAQFAPGGKHLMLMAPRGTLRHGDTVSLDFVCTDGGSTRIEFEVLKPE